MVKKLETLLELFLIFSNSSNLETTSNSVSLIFLFDLK